MALQVLARGDRWVVVDKPTGLAVHQSALVRDRDTVMRVARRQFGEVDPVHRLDKATSGCLLLSLSRAHTAALHAAHVAGEKRYVAFVRGRVAADGPIRLDQPLNDDHGNPKPAVTLLTPVAGSVDPRCSLVIATPLTGRFHQIRRHLRDLSHPVLGDSSHGDTRVNQRWRAEHGLGRLALHCLSLTVDGERVVSPLPADLRSLGERMPWWEEAVRAVPELVAWVA